MLVTLTPTVPSNRCMQDASCRIRSWYADTVDRPSAAMAAMMLTGGYSPRDRGEDQVPFVIEGRGIARQSDPVIGGGAVTSGTYSFCLERGIGMAYVSAQRAEPGTHIEIDVRGTMRSAVVERKPLYRKGS